MVEENNDIFLASDDALGQLPGPMHKKYSMAFIWGRPFSTCGSYDRFFDPSRIFSVAHMYASSVPPPFAHVT